MPLVDELKRLFRGLANSSALMIGTAAGIAQLAGLNEGWSQIVLTGIGAVCLLFLVIRWWVLFFDDKIQKLQICLDQCRSELSDAGQEIETHQAQLAILQVGHQRYIEAIEHVVDNSRSVFRERLTITVVIGVDDDADRIIEFHETEPSARMTQRTFRPILPSNATFRLVGIDDIGLRTAFRRGSCQVAPLPLVRDGVLRVWLIFRPGMSGPTNWEVEYHSRGLWAPLRESGVDTLVWTDRPPIDNNDRSVLKELVVRFIFPRGVSTAAVSERFGFGTVRAPARADGGGWLVEFRDPNPAGRRYTWDLSQQRPLPA